MTLDKDFIEVKKDHFFAKLPSGSGWVQGTPPDVTWWEAHAHFVVYEGKTVGYMRTSSYGAPDQYHIHRSLLPAKMDQV